MGDSLSYIDNLLLWTIDQRLTELIPDWDVAKAQAIKERNTIKDRK